ncbi:MAG: hypothetical protein HC923_02415 [Myxococcales bacterium]|nr:hypothetical protein [Myxococcales bacterium]
MTLSCGDSESQPTASDGGMEGGLDGDVSSFDASDGGFDSGPSDSDAGDSGNDAGGGAGFQVGVFAAGWTEEQRTQMFWGLYEDSCLRFQTTSEETATARVTLQNFFGNETLEWSLTREGEDFVFWRDAFVVEDRTLALSERGRNDGTTDRIQTFTPISSELPTVLQIQTDNSLSRTSFETENVESFESVTVNGTGTLGPLPPADHVFRYASTVITVEGREYEGFDVEHRVDGNIVATYEVVPAFGVVGAEIGGESYSLCAWRVCSPSGCAGAASCSDLTCVP